MIILLAVLGIGLVATPIVLENMEPAPVASNIVNKPTVNYSPAPVVKSKFLTDVERLGLTEYFNSITEKFEEFAKSKGINDIFVKWDEKENVWHIKKDFEIYRKRITGADEECARANKDQLSAFIHFCIFDLKFLTTKTFEEMFKRFDEYSIIKKFHRTLVKPKYIEKNIHDFVYILWHNFLIANGKNLNIAELYSSETNSIPPKDRTHTINIGISDLDKLFLINSKKLINNLSNLTISNIYACKIPSFSYICMYLRASEKMHPKKKV